MTTISNNNPNGLTTPWGLTPAQAAEFRAADPAVQAFVDRDAWNETNRPTPPVCPQWCTEDPGHQFDIAEIDSTVWTRQHTNDFTDEVTMVQVETLNASTGVVEYGDPFVTFWVLGDRVGGEYIPVTLRALVAEIAASVEVGLERFEQVTR